MMERILNNTCAAMPNHRLNPAVTPHQQRELLLQAPTQPGRPPFLSAASGLVCSEKHFFVVADDELQLGIFPLASTQSGTTQRLLQGELPLDQKPRKKHKPDFEALVYLPTSDAHRQPLLMALGSGSRANRAHGVLLMLDNNGALIEHNAPQRFDTGALYRTLEAEFGIVNIEGAVVRGDRLLLLQRGNKKDGVNAIVSLDLASSIRSMLSGDVDVSTLDEIQRIELGTHAGVALGFTDALALADGHLLALAVAEDTDDPYLDGAASASYVCHLDTHHRLLAMTPLVTSAKTEGIALWPSTNWGTSTNSGRSTNATVALVTDADDASIPAVLLTTPLSALL